METKTRTVRRYDHRLRDLVRSTGDIKHATRLGVPGSTGARLAAVQDKCSGNQ